MQEDEKLSFWRAIWAIYYRAFYHEMLAELVLARLTAWTRAVDVLTAVTASGSAVAAWTVWQMKGMSLVWVILSSTTALLSIIVQTIGVRDLVKRYSESRLAAQSLRLKVEYFRNDLEITNDWNRPLLMQELRRFQEIFESLLKQHPQDRMLETDRLKNVAQDNVDRVLGHDIDPVSYKDGKNAQESRS